MESDCRSVFRVFMYGDVNIICDWNRHRCCIIYARMENVPETGGVIHGFNCGS